MKKFLHKIVLFLIIPFVYFGINTLINFIFYSHQEVAVRNKKVLIAGDSHPMTAIDPRLFERAQNISMSAEPYAITYWKLQQIFQTTTPEILILGFSPHNISGFNDLKFSAPRFSQEMFKRIYSLDNTVDKLNNLEPEVPVDFLTYYKTFWKQMSFYPHKDHINYIGQFVNRTSSDLSGWEKIIERHYFVNDEVCDISTLSKNYLDSIVQLCTKREITLVLAGNPVHQKYYNNIPEKFIDKVSHLKKKMNDNAVIMDQTHKIYPDSLFANADHLNARGAERFTAEVIKCIEERISDIGQIKRNHIVAKQDCSFYYRNDMGNHDTTRLEVKKSSLHFLEDGFACCYFLQLFMSYV